MAKNLFVAGKLDTKALRRLGVGAAALDARGVVGAALGAEPDATLLAPARPPLRWLSNRYFAHHRANGREYRIAMTWEVLNGTRLKAAIAAGGGVGEWEYQLLCTPDAAHGTLPGQTEAASTGCGDIAEAWDFVEERLDLWLEAAAKADADASAPSPEGAL